MIINVPEFAVDHFWEEPPAGSMEFWAMRFPPKCDIGDDIFFKIGGRIQAMAKVHSIQKPGQSECDRTGKYGNRWKVFWTQESFKDLRGGANVGK